MWLTPWNRSSTTHNSSKMADYQHERGRNVAVTTVRIVGHHFSTISRLENKNQAIHDIKDYPRPKRPPMPPARENQAWWSLVRKKPIAYNTILKRERWAYGSLFTIIVRDWIISTGYCAIRPFQGRLLTNRHTVIRIKCSAELAKIGNKHRGGRSIVQMEFCLSSLVQS